MADTATETTQFIIRHETSDEHEFLPERALRVYELLREEIAAGRTWTGESEGYTPRENDSEEDRILSLFQLLEGSMFGDWIFGNLANFDCGDRIIERREDD